MTDALRGADPPLPLATDAGERVNGSALDVGLEVEGSSAAMLQADGGVPDRPPIVEPHSTVDGEDDNQEEAVAALADGAVGVEGAGIPGVVLRITESCELAVVHFLAW